MDKAGPAAGVPSGHRRNNPTATLSKLMRERQYPDVAPRLPIQLPGWAAEATDTPRQSANCPSPTSTTTGRRPPTNEDLIRPAGNSCNNGPTTYKQTLLAEPGTRTNPHSNHNPPVSTFGRQQLAEGISDACSTLSERRGDALGGPYGATVEEPTLASTDGRGPQTMIVNTYNCRRTKRRESPRTSRRGLSLNPPRGSRGVVWCGGGG